MVLRADSIRDHVRPVGRGNSHGCSRNNFIHHTAFLSRFHGRRGGILLFSYKSVSRNAPCCGVFHNRIRIGLVGRVKCGTVAVNGRRFSFSLSGVTLLFGVTGFPIIYSGCGLSTAILGSLMGPCIVLGQFKLGVNIFKLKTGPRNLVRTGGYIKIICRSPVRISGGMTTLLGRGKYSLIMYLSRLNVRVSERLITGAQGVSMVLNKRSRAFVGKPRGCRGISKGRMPIVRAKGDKIQMNHLGLALGHG